MKPSKEYIEEGKAIHDLPIEERGKLFDAAFIDLMELLRPGSTSTIEDHRRLGDLSIGTVYNQLLKRKREARDEEEKASSRQIGLNI